MNYYLLVYDRRRGAILQSRSFGPDQRESAFAQRLKEMISHRDENNVEVVLLGADSYEDLQKTHSRYFQSAEEILAGVESIKR